MREQPIAVVDLGSASFHLLVATVDADGRIVPRARRKRRVLLGHRTLVTGTIDDAAFARSLKELAVLIRQAEAERPRRIVVVATSAVRDARNGSDLAAAAERAHGLPVSVLSADAEARMAYLGAWNGLGRPAGSMAVIDLGGGSLDVARGNDQHVDTTVGLPFGALRLRDVFQRGPCLGRERAHAIAALVELTAAPALAAMKAERVVLASGTCRAVRDVVACLRGYPPSGVLRRRRLLDSLDVLAEAQPAALVRYGAKPARARTIAVAAAVLGATLRVMDAEEVVVADAGLREGVLLCAAGEAIRGRIRAA